MPISSTVVVEQFDGNGSSSTPYPLTIERDSDTDLKLLIGTVASAAFTVAVDGLRTNSPVASGTTLTVYRVTPRTQATQFPAGSTPNPGDVRAAFDKVTLLAQEVDDQKQRPWFTVAVAGPVAIDTRIRRVLCDTDTVGGDITLTLPAEATAGNGWDITVVKLGTGGDVIVQDDAASTLKTITTSLDKTTQSTDGTSWYEL